MTLIYVLIECAELIIIFDLHILVLKRDDQIGCNVLIKQIFNFKASSERRPADWFIYGQTKGESVRKETIKLCDTLEQFRLKILQFN